MSVSSSERCRSWRNGSNALQVWVGVVPVGPKGTALNSSYNNRDSREYKEDLGYAVVNFARMVPDGLLVFFPSYGVLKSCTDFWKNTSAGGSGRPHFICDCSVIDTRFMGDT